AGPRGAGWAAESAWRGRHRRPGPSGRRVRPATTAARAGCRTRALSEAPVTGARCGRAPVAPDQTGRAPPYGPPVDGMRVAKRTLPVRARAGGACWAPRMMPGGRWPSVAGFADRQPPTPLAVRL